MARESSERYMVAATHAGYRRATLQQRVISAAGYGMLSVPFTRSGTVMRWLLRHIETAYASHAVMAMLQAWRYAREVLQRKNRRRAPPASEMVEPECRTQSQYFVVSNVRRVVERRRVAMPEKSRLVRAVECYVTIGYA